jgi:hypothetical protein
MKGKWKSDNRGEIRWMGNSLLIAVDFDGTCVTHDYPKIGKDIGAVPVLKKIVSCGNDLILWTMRGNLEGDLRDAINWFSQNGIKLFCINASPGQKDWTNSPKAFAHIYIDDAALGCPVKTDINLSSRPFVDWQAVEKWLIDIGVIYEQ